MVESNFNDGYHTLGRRNTVTVMDIVRALKKNGRTIYGYGG
jgi:histone H3/H4